MEMSQLLIFITTTLVLNAMPSSGTVNALQLGEHCENDSNCHQSEQCLNSKCVNACAIKNCSKRKICQVQKHKASCICPPGFVKNKVAHKCDKKDIVGKSCSNHYTCYSWEICVNKICIDACATSVCGEHQGCFSKHHESFCYCLSGYAMNSTSNECQEHECLLNEDCRERQHCKKNAEGLRSCECVTDHVRIDDGSCVLECASSDDCNEPEFCNKDKCECKGFSKWDNKFEQCI